MGQDVSLEQLVRTSQELESAVRAHSAVDLLLRDAREREEQVPVVRQLLVIYPVVYLSTDQAPESLVAVLT